MFLPDARLFAPRHSAFRRTGELFLCAVLMLAAVDCATAQDAPSERSAADLIRQMDADRFEARMAATRALIAMGDEAITPIVVALESSPSLEVQTRGLEVLEQLARDEAELRGGAAHEALRRIEANRHSSLSRRAQNRLEQLKAHRRELAIQRLRAAGAVVRTGLVSPPEGGPPRMGVIEVEIGDEWNGTADHAQWLAHTGAVRELVLDGPHVTDEYVRPLIELDGFFRIQIKRASVTDQAIATLTSLKKCSEFAVMHTPITDAAVDDMAKIPAQLIKVYGTKITPAGHESLREALPATCLLDYRRGGFLGVGPTNLGQPLDSKGFHVGRVESNTAARRAGLRQGDIIVKYDGVVVEQFDQLRDLIAKNEVGEDVEIEFIRLGKKKKTTVTLGEWP